MTLSSRPSREAIHLLLLCPQWSQMTSQPPEGRHSLGSGKRSMHTKIGIPFPTQSSSSFTRMAGACLVKSVFKGRCISYLICWDKNHTLPSYACGSFLKAGNSDKLPILSQPVPIRGLWTVTARADPSPCFRQFLPQRSQKQPESAVPWL